MEAIWTELEKAGFKVSTDTRKDVSNTVFFCLKGDEFDGNTFALTALEKGALAVVTEDKTLEGKPGIHVVEDALSTLQDLAIERRKEFDIPVIALGGSNGKTTSRELIRDVLRTRYTVHSSVGNLNNHIGLPLSLLSMDETSELGVFEIGANHSGEHLSLLEILQPTHVTVTNNGLDHLEGFGSPIGVRSANKEIFDWARIYNATAFVDAAQTDLVEDSEGLDRVMYSSKSGKKYETKLFGDYNLANIELALAVGQHFDIEEAEALQAIADYTPSLKRSQYLDKDGIHYIVDCYNANPSSMTLALDSFFTSTSSPRGVILGDMLEMGSYAEDEHRKIVDKLANASLDLVVLIGPEFGKARGDLKCEWFPDSNAARDWFQAGNYAGYTILLKGSRGIRVENAVSLD